MREGLNFNFHDVTSSVTGGRGGTTTTVTTLDALTAAVTGDTPAIVIISGTITGNVVVKVGSNKTVVGKKGAGEFLELSP